MCIEITNISQYLDYIQSIKGIEPQLFFSEKAVYFRGLPNSNYKLIPSIFRIENEALLYNEYRMINEAIRYRPDLFSYNDNPIDLLSKLQHFSMPTRLLDITENALVALFFACVHNKLDDNNDGSVEIFILSKTRIYSNADIMANIMASFYLLNGSDMSLEKYMELVENRAFFKNSNITTENESRSTIEYFKKIHKYIKEPLFIQPILLSERQKRQAGAYIIFPNKFFEIDTIPTVLVNRLELLKFPHDQIDKKKINIKADFKTNILHQLKICGITQEYLFPEDIDLLCKSIAKNILKLYPR